LPSSRFGHEGRWEDPFLFFDRIGIADLKSSGTFENVRFRNLQPLAGCDQANGKFLKLRKERGLKQEASPDSEGKAMDYVIVF
jgi:hypothetical protein